MDQSESMETIPFYLEMAVTKEKRQGESGPYTLQNEWEKNDWGHAQVLFFPPIAHHVSPIFHSHCVMQIIMFSCVKFNANSFSKEEND